MIHATKLSLIPVGLLTLAACSTIAKKPTLEPSRLAAIDTIILGGPIYTGAQDYPVVDAVAVSDGIIAFIGNRELLLKGKNPTTKIIDLKGASMYPGFTDAHAHFLAIGMRELTLNLEETKSVAALVARVEQAIGDLKPGEALFGRGWIETGWPEGRFPNRHDLDAVSPNNPVILERADGHATVANSAALKAANITEATADPDGGRIEKDDAGMPTGMLIDNAQNAVMALLTAPSSEQKNEAYRKASDVYSAYGWTGVHNMSVDFDNLEKIESLSQSDDIKIRLYNSVDDKQLGALIKRGEKTTENGRVITRAVKLYVDGALGSRGAALSAPYSDQPTNSGLLLMEKDEATEKFTKALNAGFQVNTHAIGDRGNALLLDWYQQVMEANPEAKDLRWRIEHSQILHVKDIERFAKLNVIASMQPSHAIGDLFFAPDRLGGDRLAGAYAWRSLLDAKAVIAGGSDAPVERGDALIEFYAAVARRGLDGTQTDDWNPDQAVTRAEALTMFTLAPAYASFQEESLGTIEPGKRADFTVFSKDIMTVPEAEILNAKTVMTFIDGQLVYEAK